MPIEAAGFAPFVALAKFLAHEEEFFAGVRVLISIQQTKIGELLPHIAGHFVEQRIFSVNNFIVREGKNEIFAESVHEGKSDLVVFVFAINGIGGKIFQGVVHPAHVPFEAEAESA